MREGRNLIRQAISQWRDCYIDYQYLKIFIDVIMKVLNEYVELQQNNQDKNQEKQSKQSEHNSKQNGQNVQNLSEAVLNYRDRLKTIAEKVNLLFCEAYQIQAQKCRTFCVLKYKQINKRYQLCLNYQKIVNNQQKKKILEPYAEYTYIQASYLKKMEESNLQAERKILKKHKKYSQKIIQTHQPIIQSILQTKCIKDLIDIIEDFYVEFASEIQKKTKRKKKKIQRDYIRTLTKQRQISNKDSFSFGLWAGIFLAVIIFMSSLLGYQQKSVQTNPIFNRDFATWRGIAFIIFYIWIIGFNVLCYEWYMISHRIILDFNDHHYSTSTQIFKIAGFLSTIFAALFTMYALNLAQIVKIQKMPYQYLALIVWGMLILFMFNPFPIFRINTRIFIVKLFFKIIVSPILGVPFVIGWATDQLVSLITPFQDMVYTICYYSTSDFNIPDPSQNPCRYPARLAVFIYAVIVFSYRIMQCIRQGFDKKKYLFQLQFFNSIKYMLSLITLVLSFVWKNGNQNMFAAWLTFTIASTIYSYTWDLKVDWALLDCKSKYRLLRPKLFYSSPKFYYIAMILNLVLRLAWALTLSPNITDKTFGPQIFRLVTGAVQIFRRGLWNLLRIQKQQIKNCQDFKAIPGIRDQFEHRINYTLYEKNVNINTVQRIIEHGQAQQIQIQTDLNSKDSQISKNIEKQKFHNIKTLKQLRQKINNLQAKKLQMAQVLHQYSKQSSLLVKQIKRSIQQ